MAKNVNPRFKRPVLRNFVRQWREYRNMTQEDLAEAAGMSVSNISQFERGKQGFSDEGIQALAEALQTMSGYLLMVDPTKDDAIWSIWEQAKPGERKMIVNIARQVVGKTGT